MQLCVQAFAAAAFGRQMPATSRDRLRRAHAAVADVDLGQSLNAVRDTARAVLEGDQDPDTCQRLYQLSRCELTKGPTISPNVDPQGGLDLGSAGVSFKSKDVFNG